MNSSLTLRQLAKKYNISAATLCRMRKEGYDLENEFQVLSKLIWIDGYIMPEELKDGFNRNYRNLKM